MPVYLLHCDKPLFRAQHYLGFTERPDVCTRFERHRCGQGAKLSRAYVRNGIRFALVRVWPEGDRSLERSLKRRKNSRSLCPLCAEALNARRRERRKEHAAA